MDKLFKRTLCLSSAAVAGYSLYSEKKYQMRARQQQGIVLPQTTNMTERLRQLMPLRNSFFLSGISGDQAECAAQVDNLIDSVLSMEFDPKSLDGLKKEQRAKYEFEMKTREQHLAALKDPKAEYDLLIIGGGANGAGVVLDAASRGLKCAVVDSHDFASGTSSKSTKMAHGGIRYFQQMCLLQGDPIESYRLLKDTLNERNYFLKAAPYLVRELPLLIPSPSLFWTLFWYFPGAMAYHMIYLKQLMSSNYDVSVSGPSLVRKGALKKKYPDLKAIHGNYGAVMSETQMHDSRMNLNTLFTAAIDDYIPGMRGATLANYVALKSFVKDDSGKIIGGVCVDRLDPDQKEFTVKAKVVVNCAGVHADEIRQMDDPKVEQRIVPSRGTHLMFKKGLLPEGHGMIVPETEDGRLLFIINYFGYPMVGTTDVQTEKTQYCEPTQEEIDFICKEIRPYFGADYDFKENLVSAWAGLRPLVKEKSDEKEEIQGGNGLSLRQKLVSFLQDKVRWVAFKLHSGKTDSSSSRISRNHVIEVSNNGLTSLMGGKWTSFRSQGEETVDKILSDHQGEFRETLSNEKGQTLNFNLIGSYSRAELRDGFLQNPAQVYQQYEDYLVFEHKVPRDISKHLLREYGTAALRVAEIGLIRDKLKRLHEDFPFTEAEVLYAIQSEMAVKPNDVICRRVPVSFLDQKVTQETILPTVVDLMAKELNWNQEKKDKEIQEALAGLQAMK